MKKISEKTLNKILLGTTLSIFAIDLISKYMIVQRFGGQPYPASAPVSVIGDFFRLTYVRNYGITFGMFNDLPRTQSLMMLTVTSLLAMGVLIYLFINAKNIIQEKAVALGQIAMAMIFGGAMGNIADRIINGYVIDFLDVGWGRYRWYTFNIADIFIVSGCILLGIIMLRYEKKDPAKAAAKPQ